MKILIRSLLALVVLVHAISLHASTRVSPLIVTGTVTDVMRGKTKFSINVKDDPYIEVRIRLQYHNRSDETIIVPTPRTLGYGKRQLLFLELPSLDSKVSASADEYRFITKTADSMRFLIQELEKNEPSRYNFAVIPPRSFYETGDTFYLKSGWRLETRPSGSKSRRDQEVAVPEHEYLKLEYSLSLKDRPEGFDLLLDAQRRWSRFGKLLLNSDGDFFIGSEVIINKLAD